MRVIVVGGGIGGLTTAIALRHQGVDALVLEQAPVLNEIGAGIQIAANAALTTMDQLWHNQVGWDKSSAVTNGTR